jgi:hypothetical protein
LTGLFTPAMAAQVCGEKPEDAVRLLGRLVRKALVERSRHHAHGFGCRIYTVLTGASVSLRLRSVGLSGASRNRTHPLTPPAADGPTSAW